jgi:hypothetical protein
MAAAPFTPPAIPWLAPRVLEPGLAALQVFAVEARFEEGPFPLPASRALASSQPTWPNQDAAFRPTGCRGPAPQDGRGMQALTVPASSAITRLRVALIEAENRGIGVDPIRRCMFAGRQPRRAMPPLKHRRGQGRLGSVKKPLSHALIKGVRQRQVGSMGWIRTRQMWVPGTDSAS